ncbi:MAG: glycoside hydrolase family 3 C-terminal domain-containing protein [Anaerolineae bacterium]|nr:glycoside hydrolase family 3 C-terminal domain-containing protein [Anaerolineae bacterium]
MSQIIQEHTQPELGSRVVPVLEVDGYQFRDLNQNGQLDAYEDWRLPVETRVNDLLARLTLEEKAGLMMQPGLGMNADGSLLEEQRGHLPPTTPMILDKKIVHFNSWSSATPEAFATWNNHIQAVAERARLGIPVTLSTDPRNHYSHNPEAYTIAAGLFSMWPEPIGLAATRDAALVEQFAAIAAQEYRATGFRTALHPMADLATEPRWGRINGTFGEDADLVSELIVAYIRGFQGETLGPESVTTMTKHFPGGGPQWDGRDPHNIWGREQVYPGKNFDYHLIPFKAAIAAGTAQMMPYYGIPIGQTSEDVGMAFNKEIITDLLRDKFGFEGVICTDWGITTITCWGMEFASVRDRYKKAIDAGIDQFGGANQPEHIVDLVRSGEIDEARLDESIRRILAVTFQLGLFENPYVDPEHAREFVGSAESQAAADLAQRKSIVLLKNGKTTSSPILPLAPGTKVYVEGIHPDAAAEFASVVEQVEDADVAILRVNAPFETGPGRFGSIPMGNLAFHGEPLRHIQSISAAKPTIIAVYLGRPAVLTGIVRDAVALLGTFGVTDAALLDVLFGRFAPCGKLPFELPSSMDAVEAQLEDVPHDSENPLFEYGFGLTYSA